MMKRSAPLRRTARFGAQLTAVLDRDARVEARAARMANLAEIQRAAPAAARGVVARVLGTATPVPKEGAIQSPAYERAAKALGYCMRCGCLRARDGFLDFCHRDMGKGQGIKTDSREGWPGCRRCHEVVGRELPRPVRRAVEYLLGVMTRAAVREAGTWPKNLPQLPKEN